MRKGLREFEGNSQMLRVRASDLGLSENQAINATALFTVVSLHKAMSSKIEGVIS